MQYKTLSEKGLEPNAKMQNLSRNELNQIIKMHYQSRDELERIAKMRKIKRYKKMSNEELITSLLNSLTITLIMTKEVTVKKCLID